MAASRTVGSLVSVEGTDTSRSRLKTEMAQPRGYRLTISLEVAVGQEIVHSRL